jgi:hypothetical protein
MPRSPIPAAHSRRIARDVGDSCELVVVPDPGRMVNVSHADQVDRALRRLLDRSHRLLQPRLPLASSVSHGWSSMRSG